MRVTIPVTEDPSGSRSGFKCAIGVLDGTVVGDAMVRDCGHIDGRGSFIRSDMNYCRQLLQLQLE